MINWFRNKFFSRFCVACNRSFAKIFSDSVMLKSADGKFYRVTVCPKCADVMEKIKNG